MPQVFYCRHMYAGLAGYEDETILVDLAAMMALSKTMKGVPVYVEHQDVELENIERADGYVSDCWYNEKDGWLWAKFVAVTDAAHAAIRNGWAVSNAYMPEGDEGAGLYTNLPYNRKITGGQFTHLAIVPNPRYELAKIYNDDQYKQYISELENKTKELANSKKEKPTMAFKIFRNEKKGFDDVTDLGEVLVNHKGREVSVETLMNEVSEFEELKASLEKGTYEIQVGEGMMTLSDLVNAYKNMCEEKENESDEDEKENESEEEEKENEESEEEKENSKHFNELKNAAAKATYTAPKISLISDGLARGKAKY